MSQSQVSFVVGADERTKKILPGNKKLSPKHEQIIRKAPEELRDKVAKVILTRETKPKEPDKEPKNYVPHIICRANRF